MASCCAIKLLPPSPVARSDVTDSEMARMKLSSSGFMPGGGVNGSTGAPGSWTPGRPATAPRSQSLKVPSRTVVAASVDAAALAPGACGTIGARIGNG